MVFCESVVVLTRWNSIALVIAQVIALLVPVHRCDDQHELAHLHIAWVQCGAVVDAAHTLHDHGHRDHGDSLSSDCCFSGKGGDCDSLHFTTPAVHAPRGIAKSECAVGHCVYNLEFRWKESSHLVAAQSIGFISVLSTQSRQTPLRC